MSPHQNQFWKNYVYPVLMAFLLMFWGPNLGLAADDPTNLMGASDDFKRWQFADAKEDPEESFESPAILKAPFSMAEGPDVTIELEKRVPIKKVPEEIEEDEFEVDPFTEDEEPIPDLTDPYEGFNRSIYVFNDKVYEVILKPVATTYKNIIHEEIRIVIRNLFNNVLAPAKLFSSIIQGDLDKSGRVIGRTLINTIFGWGGMLDVAGQEFEIKDVREDFNQALGFHGIGSGPYLVLPFLGPSSVRGLVGRIVDSALNPSVIIAPGVLVGAGISTSRVVNETSFNIENLDQLKQDAVDPYVSMRDFYHQFTERQIQK